MDRPGLLVAPFLVASFLVASSLLVGCTAPSAGPAYTAAGRAVAGPTCPVEPASPVPGQCDPRPVAGAVLVITDATGHEVTRVTTGADGAWTASLGSGRYTLTPQPVAGLLGVARAITFDIPLRPGVAALDVEYETGIR